jgi:hypothetical protein
MYVSAAWHIFDNGKTVGQRGSEDGVVIRDEEHDAGARLTLERDCRIAPFAITCGLYGWFFHTRFFSAKRDAEGAFLEMKFEMEQLIHLLDEVITQRPDAEHRMLQAIESFVDRFPT